MIPHKFRLFLFLSFSSHFQILAGFKVFKRIFNNFELLIQDVVNLCSKIFRPYFRIHTTKAWNCCSLFYESRWLKNKQTPILLWDQKYSLLIADSNFHEPTVHGWMDSNIPNTIYWWWDHIVTDFRCLQIIFILLLYMLIKLLTFSNGSHAYVFMWMPYVREWVSEWEKCGKVSWIIVDFPLWKERKKVYVYKCRMWNNSKISDFFLFTSHSEIYWFASPFHMQTRTLEHYKKYTYYIHLAHMR